MSKEHTITITKADVFEMSREEFISALQENTTPEDVFEHASDIYEHLTEVFDQRCYDSLLREWAFQWWSETTKKSYNLIYDRWLG